jgi:hypothetical protein
VGVAAPWGVLLPLPGEGLGGAGLPPLLPEALLPEAWVWAQLQQRQQLLQAWPLPLQKMASPLLLLLLLL